MVAKIKTREGFDPEIRIIQEASEPVRDVRRISLSDHNKDLRRVGDGKVT